LANVLHDLFGTSLGLEMIGMATRQVDMQGDHHIATATGCIGIGTIGHTRQRVEEIGVPSKLLLRVTHES
jgi:hypothetical protein